MHENNRDDRDGFIEVNFNAIKEFEQDMFLPNGTWQKRYIKCNFTRLGRKWGCRVMNTYDYLSITHYPAFLGEGNPKQVITPKSQCTDQNCTLGQRQQISRIDIKDIETIYECGKIKRFSFIVMSI